MSCKRAQEFLARRGIADGEVQNANRQPIQGDEALTLLEGVRELLVAKGRKVQRFDLAEGRPDDGALTGAMVGSYTSLTDLLLGRSGKLRAPTMRVGNRLLVGYNQEMLETAFAPSG